MKTKRQRRQEARDKRKDAVLTDAERRKWRAYIREHTRVDPKTGCWLWQQSLAKSGYGQASKAYEHGLDTLAHRLAVVMFKGPIPKGLIARHQCHNRPCCNPKHVLVGTYKDNVDDSRRDGRMQGREKLTPEDVHEIRRLLATGAHSQGAIGAMYGLDASTIHYIKTGKNWSHLKEKQ